MDIVDKASDVEELHRALALREQSARNCVDAAGSLDGRCKDCGDLIAPARLRANPHAVRCIYCQCAMEHRNRCGA